MGASLLLLSLPPSYPSLFPQFLCVSISDPLILFLYFPISPLISMFVAAFIATRWPLYLQTSHSHFRQEGKATGTISHASKYLPAVYDRDINQQIFECSFFYLSTQEPPPLKKIFKFCLLNIFLLLFCSVKCSACSWASVK